MEADVIVPAPEGVELPAEVAEGLEADPTHEFLRQGAVKPLDLFTPSRVIRSTLDHLDPKLHAEASELLRDEAAPVVPVNRLRLPPALECPPEVVDGLRSPLPAVGAGHPQEARAIVQDGVDEDSSLHPLDAEVVDIRLPERIDMLPRKPCDDLGLADPTDHETVPLQRSMNGDPHDIHPAASEDHVDPQRTPGGVPPTQLEDPVDEIPVDAVGVAPRSARLVPQPRNAVLTMVLASVSQGPLGDPVEATDLLGSHAPLQMLLDGMQVKSNIFPDQVHPFPGAAICPDNSCGKMS